MSLCVSQSYVSRPSPLTAIRLLSASQAISVIAPAKGRYSPWKTNIRHVSLSQDADSTLVSDQLTTLLRPWRFTAIMHAEQTAN